MIPHPPDFPQAVERHAKNLIIPVDLLDDNCTMEPIAVSKTEKIADVLESPEEICRRIPRRYSDGSVNTLKCCRCFSMRAKGPASSSSVSAENDKSNLTIRRTCSDRHFTSPRRHSITAESGRFSAVRSSLLWNRGRRGSLTFDEWKRVVDERTKQERIRKLSLEKDADSCCERRLIITFEKWTRIVQNRQKAEDLRMAEEKRKEEELREEETRNRCKRRLSHGEWLEQKMLKDSTDPNLAKAGRSSILKSDNFRVSPPLTTVNIFDGRTVERKGRRCSSSPSIQKQDATDTSSTGLGDEEKMTKARNAFSKWMIKKEIAAIQQERQNLLKSRRVVSPFLRRSSSLSLPDIDETVSGLRYQHLRKSWSSTNCG